MLRWAEHPGVVHYGGPVKGWNVRGTTATANCQTGMNRIDSDETTRAGADLDSKTKEQTTNAAKKETKLEYKNKKQRNKSKEQKQRTKAKNKSTTTCGTTEGYVAVNSSL